MWDRLGTLEAHCTRPLVWWEPGTTPSSRNLVPAQAGGTQLEVGWEEGSGFFPELLAPLWQRT